MQTRSPQAAGVLIAIGAVAGLAIGFIVGRPNWWVLVGIAGGAALVVLLWLLRR